MRHNPRMVHLLIVPAVFIMAAMIAVAFPPPAFAGPEDDFISFNKAPAEEFMKIMAFDVPEAVAKAIVSYRAANGPYKTPEDIKKVPGMTDELYEEFAPVVENGDVVFEKRENPGMGAY